MRKLLFVMLVILILGTAAVEAQKKSTSKWYSNPTPTDSEGKPTDTSNKATETGKKVDTYYVAKTDNIVYDGEAGKAGGILKNPDPTKLTGGQEQLASDFYVIPSTTAVQLGKKDYTYDAALKTFSNTKTTTKKDDNLFEKYKIVTTTTTTIDENGNVKTTQDQVTKICGEGLASCTGTYTEIKGSHQTRTAEYKLQPFTDDETGKTTSKLVLSKTIDAI